MTASRILMIDDDAALNKLLTEYLLGFGYRLVTTVSAAEGRRLLKQHGADLIILDLMLPDIDGLTLCREFRSQVDTPIIMLTARGDVADRIVGLEMGADDYVPKPFEPRELVARIESVLRRTAPRGDQKVLRCKGLSLEVETRSVRCDDQDIELTTMEFELLRIFMESRGRVLSRDRLLDKLRGLEADVFDRSIDMLVSRLRNKLHENSRAPRFIKTVWRTGYQFIGEPADE